jgi:hypothetical protein
MQLLIPSLVALLIGVAITYFILPNLAPAILVAGGGFAILAAFFVHRAEFGRREYEQATWQYNLRKYGSYIMIGAILLGAYGFYAMNQVGGSSASAPLPAMEMPKIGGGFDSMIKTVASRINDLVRRGRIATD